MFIQKFALGAKVKCVSGNAKYRLRSGVGTVTECVPERNESYRVEFGNEFGNYRTKDLVSAEGLVTQGVKMLSALAKRMFDGRLKKFIEVGYLTHELGATAKLQSTAMELVTEAILKNSDLTVQELGVALEELADEEIAAKKKNKSCDNC